MRFESTRIAGMQLGDLLDLCDGIAGVAFQRDLSDHGPRPTNDMEGHVDLVLLLVALLGDRHFRLVESIFFHHPLDAGQSAVEFLLRVEFAELQAGGADQLVGGRIRWRRPRSSPCPRRNWRPSESAAGRRWFRCDPPRPEYRRTVRSKKSLHRVVQRVARKRFADLERSGRQQRRRFFRRNTRQLDLINRQAEIGRDSSELVSGCAPDCVPDRASDGAADSAGCGWAAPLVAYASTNKITGTTQRVSPVFPCGPRGSSFSLHRNPPCGISGDAFRATAIAARLRPEIQPGQP